MTYRSELIEVELPDNAGKTTSFYTYDGYLEEDQRKSIRRERKNFEKLKVTGAVIFGFVGYLVHLSTLRPLVVSLFPSSVSRASQSPSEVYFLVLWEESSAGISSLFSAQADFPPCKEKWCWPHRACLCGQT